MTEVVSRLGQEAVTPPVPAPAEHTVAVAGGLVQMILEAARTVRRDKSRCQQLAREVLMVGYLLVKLRSLGVMEDPRVAIALDRRGWTTRSSRRTSSSYPASTQKALPIAASPSPLAAGDCGPSNSVGWRRKWAITSTWIRPSAMLT